MRLNSFKLKAWVVAGSILVSSAAIAQRGSTGTSNTPSRSAPPPIRTPNAPSNTTQPIFVAGKVLLAGGGTLPEPVAIERVCNGVNRREGYTDLKGQYQFQLGQNSTFQDASESDSRLTSTSIPQPGSTNNKRAPDLTGCELRAVLAGYQSSAVILRTGGDTWQYDVAPIYLKRLGNAPGNTISVTSMAAPKDAMRAYEKAQKAVEEKPEEAEKQLDKAVKIYPQFAAAWNLLGNIHREHNQLDSARSEYAKAIAADPQYVNPIYGLTMIATQEKKWDEVAHLSDQVLKLNAGAFPMAYFFNAAANYNLQKYEAAEDSAKKFKAVDTHHEHPDVCLLLSYIDSNKQDFAGAAREIRDYLAVAPNSPNADSLRTEAKRLEDLSVSAKRQ